MLDLENRTAWSAGIYPAWGGKGGRKWTVVIKAGFSFDLSGELTPVERPPIEEADRYHGEPGKSSLAAASEVVPFKAGGEILLAGTAHPPRPDATVMEVEAALLRPDGSQWRKTLRVFGPRRWERSLFGAVPETPAPLSPLPLLYEHAYGGGEPGAEDLRNPVGRGHGSRGYGELPRIEIGPAFIISPSSRPEPAGFGPLPLHWEPRAKLFQGLGGNVEGRELPADLYNCAPVDQRFRVPFGGGELLTLRGLVEEAPSKGISLRLPKLRPEPVLVIDDETHVTLAPLCDTLVVDSDRQAIQLLWRSGFELPFEDEQAARMVLCDGEEEEDS